MAKSRLLAFNDRAVRAAAYLNGSETEYRIDGHPGLVLVVRRPKQSGQGTRGWRYHYSIQTNGQQIKRRVALGDYPDVSLSAARKLAADLATRVERQGDVVALDRARKETDTKNNLTFAAFFEEYLIERAGLTRIGEFEREMRKDALPVIGHKHPALITPGDADSVGRAILSRSPAMAYRIIEHIKTMYNFCLLDRPSIAEKYGITSNPAALLGRRRRGSQSGYARPKARDRFLDDGEIAEFWPALSDCEMRPLTKLGIQLVLVTAQRPGEVRRARLSDLHLRGQKPHWIIPKRHSKNGREHYVPLSPLAVQLFKRAIEIGGSKIIVFPEE